ncbi:hypothetical protein ABZ509_11780, partial [Streptomyces lavendulocolor]
MDDWAVRAEGLEKRYGEKRALDGFDLAVRPGTVHGLLGPNGAAPSHITTAVPAVMVMTIRMVTKIDRSGTT